MSLTLDTTQSLLPYPQYAPWEFNPGILNPDTSTPVQWRRPENFARRLPDATVATTGNLSATYANGTMGVGATLTATSNGALSIDTYSLFAGDRVCVKNQTSALENGFYVVTDAGSAGTPWVLTRDELMDSTAEFVGFLLVLMGSTNGGKIFLCPPNGITVGSSAVTFAEWKHRFLFGSIPSGVTGNIATGRLSGPGTVAGPSRVSIRGSKDGGATWGEPIYVTIGIDERPPPAQSGVDLTIDVATKTVTGPGSGENNVLLTLKYGDDFLGRIQFVKNGSVLDLGTLKSLKIGIKQSDEEPLVAIGGGEEGDGADPIRFGKAGSGTDAIYLLYCQLVGNRLKGIISEGVQDETGTYVDCLCEIEWQEENPTDVGPEFLRFTSPSFRVRIYLELVA